MPIIGIDSFPARYRLRFCPVCATPLARIADHGVERLACPACRWVFYPAPNLAATTVVEYEGGVVLLRRAIEPDRGIWHLPIGHLEYGEPPVEAAKREAEEETGLVLDEPVLLDMEYGPSYEDRLMYYCVFCFSARAVGGSLRTDHENSEAWVCPPEQLPELKWSSQQRALAAWRRRRAGTIPPSHHPHL